MIGVAKTGSGKTLAFLLPAFLFIKREQLENPKIKFDRHHGPHTVVLTPTRELCQQIYEEAYKFGSLAGDAVLNNCVYVACNKLNLYCIKN